MLTKNKRTNGSKVQETKAAPFKKPVMTTTIASTIGGKK
jgi:hypothetical protein